MGIMVYSLLWVMEDLDHQTYHGSAIHTMGVLYGLRIDSLKSLEGKLGGPGAE